MGDVDTHGRLRTFIQSSLRRPGHEAAARDLYLALSAAALGAADWALSTLNPGIKGPDRSLSRATLPLP